MKINNLIMGITCVMAFTALTSCSDVPTYPEADRINSGVISATINGETITLEPVNATLGADFMRGFDASACNDTAYKGTYCTASGASKDLFDILADYGYNWVRLRVWNDPANGNIPTGGSPAGASDKATVVNQAKRAKAAGLKVLLDFHYSDYWADPAKQAIPKAWLTAGDVTNADTVAEKISEYTKEVLQALNDANAAPDMIQIGNEINSGILRHKSLNSSEVGTDATVIGTGANLIKYLESGIAAAKEVCPNAKIMLHLANGGADLNKLLSSFTSLKYDVIGLSWYSEWANHKTIGDLKSRIAEYKEKYGKEVVVVETNAHYNKNSDDSSIAQQTANLKMDGKIYPGILTDSKGNIVYSVQNQANIIRAVVEVTGAAEGSGVFLWGGEYTGAWNSVFDSTGKPLASIIALTVKGK